MIQQGDALAFVSFAVAACTYALLAAFMLWSWKGGPDQSSRGRAGLTFIIAVAVTALWAAARASQAAFAVPAPVIDLLGVARPIAWLVLAYVALRLLSERARSAAARDPLLVALMILAPLCLLAVAGSRVAPWSGAAASDLRFAGLLGTSVFGLVLIENLYQAARGQAMWAVKHLLIGLGAMFAFDLFMYADALLLKRTSAISQAAQPLIAVLAAPLLLVAAARLRDFNIQAHVSRRVAVHTAALVSCGLYLLAAAAIAAVLRRYDLAWGPTLQAVFLVGALLVLAVLLSSAQARAHGRHFIERNFFSLAYDYREEWLKLVRTMSESRQGSSVPERALEATAGILQCNAGALFLRRPGEAGLEAATFWQWSKPPDLAPPPPALLRLVSAERPALELRPDQPFAPDPEQDAAVRAWLGEFRQAWLLIGLSVRGQMLGLMLIGRPMVARRLTWEDHDLLSVVASQMGSYLAIEQMARQLAEAQRFEQVSRHFSFVAHDLKNLITQLSLIVSQARRHADNPAFFEDALTTVGEAVEKMRAMVLRLRESAPDDAPREPVDLADLIRRWAEQARAHGRPVTCRIQAEEVVVLAGADQLRSILQNLIDNACEAQGEAQMQVEILVGREGDQAVLEVADDGPGMSARFVEEELFSPFSSTKPDGFGIGMYQCRMAVERWGGRIDVHSMVGRGTTVRIMLPLHRARAPQSLTAAA